MKRQFIDWMPEQQQLDYEKWRRGKHAFNLGEITNYFMAGKIGSLIERYTTIARPPPLESVAYLSS